MKNSDYDQECFYAKCNYIQLAPSNYISIVRCVFSKEKNDWKSTAIFHTFIKIGDNNWKVIVNSGSCVNAVSSKIIEKVGWKAEPHPHPYKMSWINSTALDVKQRCLVSIKFDVYKDKIWCDVVTMDVGQIILWRSWLYDNDVTIHDGSNMCRFEHESKKIKLTSYRPIDKKPKLNALKKSKGVNLVSAMNKNSRTVPHSWS